MYSEKKEKYVKLIEEMRECHICQNIKAPAYSEDGECLINDNHGIVSEQEIDVDKIYVNRWNMWQGSLDADIMVIGLDFGRIMIGDINEAEEHRWWKKENQTEADTVLKWKSPTDENLYRIFRKVFGEGFRLTEKCDKLYFTNVACCYRQKRTSGVANDAWYLFCARKYLGRLIQIIEPKLIIALGLQAFESLGCCENGRIICTDEVKPKGKLSLKELLNVQRPYHFELEIGDKRIKLAPVFHPGTNRNMNRKPEEEYADWERIQKIYEHLKWRDF